MRTSLLDNFSDYLPVHFSEESKRSLWFIFLATGLIILIFVGYRILYMSGVSEYAKEFTAGCIGAVITIFATAALLKSQTENEISRDQLAEVFREKLTLYRTFIEFLNEINDDGEITSDEIKKIVKWGGTLSLVANPRVIRVLYEYIFQIVAFGSDSYADLTDAQKLEWKKWMLQFYDDMEANFQDEEFCRICYSDKPVIITALRDDLANKKLSNFDMNLEMNSCLDDLFSLESVVEIKLNDDGTHEIMSMYDVPVKPRKRTKKTDLKTHDLAP
jgi:hypothetical protein